MIVYEQAEKFIAEICKSISYFFASITGLIIIKMTVYGENILRFCNLQGCTALILIILSYFMIKITFILYADLDYKLSKKNDKINYKEKPNE